MPATPERLMIDACIRYAAEVAGCGLAVIRLTFTDVGERRIRLPPGYRADPPAAATAPAVKLVGADAGLILDAVRRLGPVPAKVLVDKVEVERSRLYVLLSDLADRGLVREGRDGYEAADGADRIGRAA